MLTIALSTVDGVNCCVVCPAHPDIGRNMFECKICKRTSATQSPSAGYEREIPDIEKRNRFGGFTASALYTGVQFCMPKARKLMQHGSQHSVNATVNTTVNTSKTLGKSSKCIHTRQRNMPEHSNRWISGIWGVLTVMMTVHLSLLCPEHQNARCLAC